MMESYISSKKNTPKSHEHSLFMNQAHTLLVKFIKQIVQLDFYSEPNYSKMIQILKNVVENFRQLEGMDMCVTAQTFDIDASTFFGSECFDVGF